MKFADRWSSYFYKVACAVASNSKCFSRSIGAILVKDKSIISTGYNGPARGIPLCNSRHVEEGEKKIYLGSAELVCPRRVLGYKSGEGLDICIAAHAETNCIANAARMGVCTYGSSMYMTCEIPCKNCLTLIINAGIQHLIVSEIKFYDKQTQYLVDNSKLVISDYSGSAYRKD